MAGAYCRYCNLRCFVLRWIPDGPRAGWSGHLATCGSGMAHDLRVTGHTHVTAINPHDGRRGDGTEWAPRAVHVPIQIGTHEPDGTRSFMSPGDVCEGCSDPDTGRWVPVSQCPRALARVDELTAFMFGPLTTPEPAWLGPVEASRRWPW